MKKNFCLGILCLLSVLFSVNVFAQTCTLAGWATQNGGTTGGGSATPITVSTLADLQAQANSVGAKVIYVSGTMGSGVNTRVVVQANKTIIGLPGAQLFGGFDIKSNNVIIRNMKVRGPGAVDVNGVDCITIQSCTNVWIDHCDIWDGQDGNLDISNDANYITVSWTKFSYTSASTNHQFCNLIGSSDTRTTDRGKLKITFLGNWWAAGCKERMPRVRFGQVHVVNNYFNSVGNNHCVRAGIEANLLVEGNYFESVSTPVDLFENNFTAVTVRNNTFVSVTGNTLGSGTAFTPPYALTVQPSANVKALVTDPSTGAGATLSSPTACDGGGTTTTYTLTTSSTPAAGGSVSSSPNASSYNAGTPVTLTATPAAGYTFTGWSGDATGTSASITVTMDANKIVTANFQQQTATTTYTLTTSASPAAGGTVTRSPNAAAYDSSTAVTLTATPASGYTFSGWSGDATGTGSSVTLTMDANKTVTANFTAITGGTTSTIRIEDTNTPGTGLCSFDGSISSNSGAANTKVINLTNSSLKGITWSIGTPAAGSYSFNWRYTNGGSSNATTMKLIVNGVTINSALSFPKTASSTTFSNVTLSLSLAAGSNSVRLETTVSSATADIDWLEVTGISPVAGPCPGATARSITKGTEPVAEEATSFDVYPNPARGKARVAFYAAAPERVTMTLHAADGRTVEIQSYAVAKGNQQKTLSLVGLRSGVYYLLLLHESGQRETRKIIIE
jgi:uncharacterized repeat protein (TIGR02543 family)